MLEILNYGGALAGVAGAVSFIIASIRTNAARIWKEEAEAHKARADRLIEELEEVKGKLSDLEDKTQVLISLLSAIDPQKLEGLQTGRH